ncbi:DNA-binding protein [Persicimonas caeni]|uniref:DNA-binding protein n=1 Tax=Persicimonas caeni TaxID=2292766 RepID=A0A4Y6PV39_PERCE|nr:PPC domain-containing DNA-binding protein [Persicimonas caeni]QDG51979.1 DNA-binding protein [Persicimonas caeni]QED33200.1 DNA-binding protein [Persicimonas caeni]
MIFQETTRTRRLLGRIEPGEDLVETLTDLCREHDVHAGQIQAIGALSQAEIARFDAEKGDYTTVFAGEGNFDLISLSGNVSRLGDQVVLRLESLMSVMGPAGPQVLSGQLRAGKAASVEFVLEIFEDLAMERRLDPDSGRLDVRSIRRTQEAKPAPKTPEAPAEPAAPTPAKPAREEKPVAKPAEKPAREEKPAEKPAAKEPEPQKPIAGKGMSWKDAAGESSEVASGKTPSRRSKPAETTSAEDIYGDIDFEEPLLEPGDILEHPKLGSCRVIKVEEGDFAHVRLPRGRIRKLSLEIVDVEFDREENGRRVFKAKIGR